MITRLIGIFIAFASASAAQERFEAIRADIDGIAAGEISRAADESVQFLDRPIETEGNCRRIDLRAYQQENPYFRTDFEQQIDFCAKVRAPLYWRDWGALEDAINDPDPDYYGVTVETKLEFAAAGSPEDHVVQLTIARNLIANHKAGTPQPEATMQAFLQCVAYTNEFANWSSKTYPPIQPIRREQNRGQIVCGE